jgi:hypothetical protein
MKTHRLEVFGTSILIVVLSTATIAAPATAQTRLAPQPFDCSTVGEMPSVECQALVALYEGTNGPGWMNHGGWLTTSTPCGWYGLTCDAGHVTGLDLVLQRQMFLVQ